MTLYNINHATGVTQSDLVNLCPALIHQQLSGVCAKETHKEEEEDDDKKKSTYKYGCTTFDRLQLIS